MSLHRRRTFLSAFGVIAGASVLAAPFLRSFTPPGSRDAFLAFLEGRSIVPGTASLRRLVDGTVAFYLEAEADGLAASPQSDMLLFQWGVHDWGQGENFEFDITRQFISAFAFGDDAMSQLHMTVRFAPTPALRRLGRGNRWCARRADAQDFRAFVVSSPAFGLASALQPKRVEVSWSRV